MNWHHIEKDRVDGEKRVSVLGYQWGMDISPLRQAIERNKSSSTNELFDVAILSECLWLHEEHENLSRSINNLLCSGGIALVTYSHHIPGKEKQDDAFFLLCKETYGMETELIGKRELEYMWDSTKTMTVYLKILRKP